MNNTEKKIKLSQAKYILSIPLPLAACKGVIIDFNAVFFYSKSFKVTSLGLGYPSIQLSQW